MSANNNITIVGHVGRDPEMKAITDSVSVTTFTVGVTRVGSKDKLTDWFNIKMFGRNAANSQDMVKKGSLISIKGSVRIDRYEQDNQQKTFVYINGDSFQLFGKRDDNSNNSYQSRKPVDDFDNDDVPAF